MVDRGIVHDDAKTVDHAAYMEHYAAQRFEWVDGELVKMPPIGLEHDELTAYVRNLVEAFFAFSSIGRIIGEPFVLDMRHINVSREPDLQIVLNDNPGQLTRTAMIGAADICIEVVSPESGARDYGDKFIEYEKAGVQEYWILDYGRKSTHFYRLNEDGIYSVQSPDLAGSYMTPLLPRFKLHVPTLWEHPLPNVVQVVETMRHMLADE